MEAAGGGAQGTGRPGPLAQGSHLPVPERGDEVQTAVHTVVLDVLAVEATLVPEILLKLLVHIVGDGLPAGGRGAHEASRAGSRGLGLPRQAFLTTQSC